MTNISSVYLIEHVKIKEIIELEEETVGDE